MIRRVFFSLSILALLGATPQSTSGPSLSAVQKDVLDRYIKALGSGNYPAAFALLSADGRRYFASADNYASVSVYRPRFIRVKVLSSMSR